MTNTYIIPTLGRETIGRTIHAILREDPSAQILICNGGHSAGDNRNKGLAQARGEWIIFCDDDDFFNPGYLHHLTQDVDLVVFRMMQHGRIIPDVTNELRIGNVGINFAIRRSFWEKEKPHFDDGKMEEDWRFLKQLLSLSPRIKITDEVFYNAPASSHIKSPLNQEDQAVLWANKCAEEARKLEAYKQTIRPQLYHGMKALFRKIMGKKK